MVFDNSPCALVIVNNENEIINVNLQLEKLFGYQKTELLGKKSLR